MYNPNYGLLADLGRFYPLQIYLDPERVKTQLNQLNCQWHPYNPRKPGFKREGISLFSLDGTTDGAIDLDSIREYNLEKGTNYDESSFATPTSHWFNLPEISETFKELEPELVRSHILRFSEGGFFPPHRDLGDCFRLISFFNCNANCLYFMLDGEKVAFDPGVVYFADTRKPHCLFNFNMEPSYVLVLNVRPNEHSRDFILENLLEL
jgi:hypothetical protein